MADYVQGQNKQEASPQTANLDVSSQKPSQRPKRSADDDSTFLGQFSQKKKRQRLENEKKRSSESQAVLEAKGVILSHAREMKKAKRLLVDTQPSRSECLSQINVKGTQECRTKPTHELEPQSQEKRCQSIFGLNPT